jgi:hypothetical protein
MTQLSQRSHHIPPQAGHIQLAQRHHQAAHHRHEAPRLLHDAAWPPSTCELGGEGHHLPRATAKQLAIAVVCTAAVHLQARRRGSSPPRATAKPLAIAIVCIAAVLLLTLVSFSIVMECGPC